ncbi:MAG: hypothetical protein IPK99_08760 [Flavobacteriales bacterium]|nr:hypothetical protein [Flavobacteriales bacterium]
MASILLASQGQLTMACGLVFVAALLDVLDGLAARATGGEVNWASNSIAWRIW